MFLAPKMYFLAKDDTFSNLILQKCKGIRYNKLTPQFW